MTDDKPRGYVPPAQTVEWETPRGLFAKLAEEFGPFDLDPAATKDNAKAPEFFTEREDGLLRSWGADRRVYVNPPYGHVLGMWVEKAALAAERRCLVVMLLPARTDTRWFHDHIYRKPNVEVRFLRGRVRYGKENKPAPFPSMIVVFRPKEVSA